MGQEIIKVVSIFNLGVAVGTLTSLGVTEEEIAAMVKENIENSKQAIGCVTSHTNKPGV